MVKVNEHPWKFPDGRIACGLTPLGKRKFSSFWLTDTRCWFALWRFFRLNFLTELLYLWLDWMKWTLVACFHCREWMKLAPRTCSWIDARWAFHNNFRCLCHFVASYCFNLSYLHIVWRQNCDGCRSRPPLWFLVESTAPRWSLFSSKYSSPEGVTARRSIDLFVTHWFSLPCLPKYSEM